MSAYYADTPTDGAYNNTAHLALVLGILSIFIAPWLWLAWPVAGVGMGLGIAAFKMTRTRAVTSNGAAIWAIVTSGIGLFIGAVQVAFAAVVLWSAILS